MMRRKHRKKRHMFGEKVIGAGFMLVLIFGSCLDGSNWIFPMIMMGVGMVVMVAGNVIAKSEESEYV